VEVHIATPDAKERLNFFKNHSPILKISNSQEIADEKHKDSQEAVALTDGMSFKQIAQIGRIPTKILDGDKQLSFKERYQIVQFNNKESE
jgi:hypothetical protein